MSSGPSTGLLISSLGWNCEPALYLRARGMLAPKGYFAFSAVPFPALCKLLRDGFDSAFQPNHCRVVGGMIEETTLGIATHNPLRDKTAANFGITNEDDLLSFVYADRLKRAELFIAALPTPRTYVLKYEGEAVKDDAERLQALLATHGLSQGSTIIVVNTDTGDAPWSVSGLVNAHIDRFAPFDCIETYEANEWDKALGCLLPQSSPRRPK